MQPRTKFFKHIAILASAHMPGCPHGAPEQTSVCEQMPGYYEIGRDTLSVFYGGVKTNSQIEQMYLQSGLSCK